MLNEKEIMDALEKGINTIKHLQDEVRHYEKIALVSFSILFGFLGAEITTILIYVAAK